MKKTNKILAIILAILMVLSIVPVTASATSPTSGVCGANVTWTFDEATETLTISGTGDMISFNGASRPGQDFSSQIKNVVIEDGVTSIGEYAFYEYPNIVSVTIPDSVKVIGNDAFYRCTKLTDISLPEGLTSIGVCAFYCCENLTSITIPDSVTSIGHTAFYGCSALKTAVIGSNVKTITSSLFNKCSSLESVTLPDGITEIKGSAFQGCVKLTSIDIPDSVDTIGGCAFSHCESLEQIVIPEGVTLIESDTFNSCTKLNTITIPVSVTEIESQAFYNCTGLKYVYYTGFKSQWTNIKIGSLNNHCLTSARRFYKEADEISDTCGDNATWTYNFTTHTLTISGTGAMYDYDVDNRPWEVYEDEIEKVVVVNGITTIGICAFNGCEKLASVTIPASVTTIKSRAFSYCQSLISFTIPDTVTTLGAVFGSCYNLKDVVIGEGITEISNSLFYDCNNLENVTIKGDITSVGRMAFYRCTSLKEIDLGNSVTKIEEYAFEDCTNLESIKLGNSLTTIEQWAFGDCTSLASITFPDTLTTIGNYAFTGCNNLKTIAIGSGLTTIGLYAFGGCSKIESITVDTDNQHFSSDEFGVLFNKDKTILIMYPVGNTRTNYDIPDSVVTIESQSFANCLNLTSIKVGSGVEVVEDQAFAGCENIDDIYFALSEYEWYFQATVGKKNDPFTYATRHYREQNPVTGVCGDNAVWVYDADTGELTITGSGAMYNYDTDARPWEPFSDRIETVVINEGITNVGDYAFAGFTKIETISIPDSVTKIGVGAFEGCENLRTVFVGADLTEIGAYAFNGCPILTDVYFKGTEEQWNDVTVGNNNKWLNNATIHYGYCEHEYTSEIIAPTCTEQGYTTHTCNKCDYCYNDDYVEATGHADNDGDEYCDACDELLDPTVECECNCHKGGISGFFWNIRMFFSRIFKTNHYCECGVAHY